MFSCLFCGNQRQQVKSNSNKFCCVQCRKDYEYTTYIQRWQIGEETGGRGSGVSRYIRRYLFEKYKNKCCSCGWCEVNLVTCKCPLEVEHVDGNHKNNKEDNLKLLCPNCHSLTSTFKALNKGNGRFSRRKNYKDGKSY